MNGETMKSQEIEMIKDLPGNAWVNGVPKGTRGVIVSGPDYDPPEGKIAVEFNSVDLGYDEDLDDDEKTIVRYIPTDFFKHVDVPK